MFTCLPEPGYFLGSITAIIETFSIKDNLIYLENSQTTFILIPENLGNHAVQGEFLHISYEAALSDNTANPTAWSLIIRPLGADA